MAYGRKKRAAPRRSTGKRASARGSYSSSRSTSRKSYARKSASRTGRRTASLGRTLRIVIEQPGASMVARPDMIGVKPDLVRRNTGRSRF